MATAATALVAFAEFEKLSDPPRSRPELHKLHNEEVEKAFPADRVVETQLGFKPGQRDYRAADVAILSNEVWSGVPHGRHLEVAPPVVIGILSPSNTATEMFHKEQRGLKNGCAEFWIVDPKKRTVRISMPSGHLSFYKSGGQIPILYGGTLALDAIFA